jgi:1-acyl-sn-glycerol-3-phosphate acyltransferase
MRAYVRLGLFFYFKRIEVANLEGIPKNESVMFLANHQNALLDALLIATKNGRFPYFLTRASVFNKPIVRHFLKSLQMLPVYRIRDGWGNLNKNKSIFSKSSKLLSEKEAIVIFPEGSHNLKRTVRPLSKGFTRIIFETLEAFPDTKIHLVPVGLNFQNPTEFGDSTLINIGRPILLDSELGNDKNKSVVELKEAVSDQLRQLTTHIENDHYDATLQQLKTLEVDFTKPKAVNQCIASGFKSCKKRSSSQTHFLKRLAKFLLIINLFIPYIIWKKVAQPKIKEIEFTSTFRFAIAMTLVPIFIILVMLVFGIAFQPKFAFMYLLNVIVLTLVSVKL